MKSCWNLIVFLVLFGPWRILAQGVGTNEWGASANDIQLYIGLQQGQTPIKTNEPFHLAIRIENNSTNQFFYFYTRNGMVDGDPIFFTIISPSGKDVSPVPPLVDVGSGGNINLPPKGVYRFSKGYCPLQFSELGTYKISAKIKANDNDWADSNPLSVTVVPGHFQPLPDDSWP
jgi:hypothetical protein